MSNIAR